MSEVDIALQHATENVSMTEILKETEQMVKQTKSNATIECIEEKKGDSK